MTMLPMTTNPRFPPISAFFVAFPIFVVRERRDFKFSTLLDRNWSQHTDDKSSLKGAGLWSLDPFKCLLPPKISPDWLTLDTSNFVHWLAIICGTIIKNQTKVALIICSATLSGGVFSQSFTIDDLISAGDKKLFCRITSNNNHCLHSLIPQKTH